MMKFVLLVVIDYIDQRLLIIDEPDGGHLLKGNKPQTGSQSSIFLLH